MTTTKSTKTAAKKSTSKTAATRALREKKATKPEPTLAETVLAGMKAKIEKAEKAPKKSKVAAEPPAALPTLRAIYNAAMKSNVDRKALAAELGVELKAKATTRDLARAIAKAVVANGKLPSALAEVVTKSSKKTKAPRGPSRFDLMLSMLIEGATLEEMTKRFVKEFPVDSKGREETPARAAAWIRGGIWALRKGRGSFITTAFGPINVTETKEGRFHIAKKLAVVNQDGRFALAS